MSHTLRKQKITELDRKTTARRKAMNATEYNATIENDFFPVMRDSVYQMITEDKGHEAEKR